jgi:hypothetical protein
LASLSAPAFAENYHCKVTVLHPINQYKTSLEDSAEVTLESPGEGIAKLPVSKKQLKIRLSELPTETFGDQMAATIWIGIDAADGATSRSDVLAASVSKTARTFQIQSIIKKGFYNLMCEKK